MQYLTQHQRIVLALSLVVIAMIASGCVSTPTPYVQGFIGQRLGNDSFASCSDENAGVRIGVDIQLSKRWHVAPEYEHISHLLCGKPFNDKAEDDTDHIGVTLTYRMRR